MINAPSNSCWLWSSFRIAKIWTKQNGQPKDLHSELLKKFLNKDNINIQQYNETTIKDADIDAYNCGNAVEYLTLNGFYYDDSLIITPKLIPQGNFIVNIPILHYEIIYAILIQLMGHFQSVIQEDDGYYLYDQSSNVGTKRKLQIVNNCLMVPVNRRFTILYFYKHHEPNKYKDSIARKPFN